MHEPPPKLEKGWKLHKDAYNNLLDYVVKTRPIIAHGHTETNNGTMPPPQPAKTLQQFAPLLGGDPLKLAIHPGYVYGPYDDGNSETTPMVQQWPYEPKIGTTLLSATEKPTLSLSTSSTNYIYLKLKWLKAFQDIGGSDCSSGGSQFAFRADYSLSVNVDGADLSVGDGTGYQSGIHVKVNRVMYYLNECTFEVNQNSTPPTETIETDIFTYLLAGHITLDANGRPAASGNTEPIRWFLNGPVFANKPPDYIGTTDQDRDEPVPPVAASGQSIPGHA